MAVGRPFAALRLAWIVETVVDERLTAAIA
jgi:hypothetical protein